MIQLPEDAVAVSLRVWTLEDSLPGSQSYLPLQLAV